MLKNKDIAVVILNYNGKKWLEQFLPSVVKYSSEAEIIIADNGSSDNSLAFLETTYPTIKTIILNKNYGFTGGYNKALFQLNHKYFVLLNSDIEVTKDWLKGPIDLLETNHSIAACQPKIKSFKNKKMFEHAGAAGGMIDKFGYPFCRGRIFMTAEEDKGQFEKEEPVFWASGACLFIRSNLYKQFNGLQEEFFAHMEEIDLCWRLRSAGHEIYYTPKSEVFHVGGGTLNTSNPRKTFLNFRNGLALLLINLPSKYLIPVILYRLILDGIAGIEFLAVGHWRDTLAIIKAHYSFYAQFSTWTKARSFARTTRFVNSYDQTFKKSIVWQYFIMKRKYYSEL